MLFYILSRVIHIHASVSEKARCYLARFANLLTTIIYLRIKPLCPPRIRFVISIMHRVHLFWSGSILIPLACLLFIISCRSPNYLVQLLFSNLAGPFRYQVLTQLVRLCVRRRFLNWEIIPVFVVIPRLVTSGLFPQSRSLSASLIVGQKFPCRFGYLRVPFPLSLRLINAVKKQAITH